MSRLINLCELIKDAVIADRDAAAYTYGADFDVARTWLPWSLLEVLKAGSPKVWVIGLASDDMGGTTRTHLATREIPVQIGMQATVTDYTDPSLIDPYVRLKEEIQDKTLRQTFVDGDNNKYAWLRTEGLKDMNGAPYSFIAIRESGTFETFFTAFYKVVVPPPS